MKALKVSELNIQIKSLLEQTFLDVCVQGEISSVKTHTSGHIYLSLKDESSSVKCVMFRGNTRGLKFKLEVGQNVIIMGGISVYAPKGEYQILCKSITLAGVGELALAFENLKSKLQAKGYFESYHKKPMPPFPKRIALLTSATGAAKEDMLKVARKRWEHVSITLFDTLVQGENAKDCIVANLALADSKFGTKDGFDVIVLGRGGGSMEDMWAFNEECVADAIYQARTPIVSAVGHEVDVFISDFVADLRAPTPSAAMEMLLPDKFEFLRMIDEMMYSYALVLDKYIARQDERIKQIEAYLNLYNFHSQYASKLEQIQILQSVFTGHVLRLLQEKGEGINMLYMQLGMACEKELSRIESHTYRLHESFKAYNPHSLRQNGYAQITQGEKIISLKEIEIGGVFELDDLDSHIFAKRIE